MGANCKVFTPDPIVDFMLDTVGYSGNQYGKRIVENSCGEGNILCAIARRYIEGLSGHDMAFIKRGLEQDIVGYDVDESCCIITKKNLDEIARQYNIFDVEWNVTCADTLRIANEESYDYVVGNPPYISYRHLEQERRAFLRGNYEACKIGAFDYCYAFIEWGIKYLKAEGQMIYLIPSSIFKNVHGKKLRMIMADDLTAIYDYTSRKLFGKILTSSALIVFKKDCKCDSFIYKNMASEESWQIIKEHLGDKWIFEKPVVKAKEKRRFGDYFSSAIVIATLYNAAFVLSGFEEKDGLLTLPDGRKIEKEATRKTASPRGLRNGKEERIIFPYDYHERILVRFPEDEFTQRYPYTTEYLSSFREQLDKRDSDKNVAWYEYGRSQALKHLCQRKLLISTIITSQVEVYYLDEDCIPYAGIYITPINDLPLEMAYRILTSSEFMEYVLNIGIYANGHSVRITPKDIANFEFTL